MSAYEPRPLTDDELGRLVASVDVAWPATPDLRAAVAAGITTAVRPRGGFSLLPRRRRLILLVAVLVVALATVAGAAKLLWDLGAVIVRFEPSLSLPPRTLGPQDLGTALPLEDAEARVGLEAPLPADLGRPDRVWVDTVEMPGVTGERLALAWAPRTDLPRIRGTPWGAVLMVFRGDDAIAAKGLPTTPTVTFVHASIDGVRGSWIAGPHLLELLGSDGLETFTVTGHVLLWSPSPGIVLRLETALPKTEARALAASVR